MKKFLKWLFQGPEIETSLVNHPYARATTPDELISAGVIELIAKDFDGWTHRSSPQKSSYENTKFKLEHICKKVLVEWEKHYYDNSMVFVRINGVDIDIKDGIKIVNSYKDIHTKREELKRVAKEAKRKMEENEKKWNVAESILGMKRNKNGALVPVVRAE